MDSNCACGESESVLLWPVAHYRICLSIIEDFARATHLFRDDYERSKEEGCSRRGGVEEGKDGLDGAAEVGEGGDGGGQGGEEVDPLQLPHLQPEAGV